MNTDSVNLNEIIGKSKPLNEMSNNELLYVMNTASNKAKEYRDLLLHYVDKFDQAEADYQAAITMLNSRMS